MIGYFLSWYCTLREDSNSAGPKVRVGLESCSKLRSRKRIVTSAVVISNELEQVCSLAYLKATSKAEVPLRISNSLLDKTRSIMLNSLRRLVSCDGSSRE